MTRPPLPGSALDDLLGQPFGSVAWQDALERLEGPHPLDQEPGLQAVMALPVMERLAPEFERRQMIPLAKDVQDNGEAALYVTVGHPRGPKHLIGSTERTQEGLALRVFGYPLAQALKVSDPLTPVAALFAPAPAPTRVSARVEVSIDHPGGMQQAAFERMGQDHLRVLPTGVYFEVVEHHGRSLTLDISAEVGHGPDGLAWAERTTALSAGSPGFP